MCYETKASASRGDTRTALEGLLNAFETFKTVNDQRLRALETKSSADPLLDDQLNRIDQALADHQAKLDRMARATARPVLSETKSRTDTRWRDYLRTGESRNLPEAKALSHSTPNQGGYIAPAETEHRISRLLAEVSPMRQVASVRVAGSHTFKKPISLGQSTASWAGDTAARSETDTPALDLLEFPVAELYAMPAATTSLIEDSFVDMDQWLAEEVRDVFSEAESLAFIQGTGTNQPKGLLSYTKKADGTQDWGELGYVPSGADGDFAATSPVDAIIDLIYAPKAAYRAQASFMMNKQTVSRLRKFKDADGNYIWQPASTIASVPTLMGYPVIEAEDMPDIGTNQYAIAFGDFERGYLIVDRQGVQVLRDPYSAKPYILFYTTKRVGGGVQDFNAIKLMKFATS